MATSSPPRPVAVLEGAIAWTHDCLQLARRRPMETLTPCADWDLGDLLLHMDDSLVALGEAAELGRMGVEGVPARPMTWHLVDRIVQRACRTRDAWTTRLTSAPIDVGDLRLGRDTLAYVGALEIVVHGWDVSRACEDERVIPDELAEPLHDVAVALVTPADRGHRFAAPVPVAVGAPVGVRLLAHLGRSAGGLQP